MVKRRRRRPRQPRQCPVYLGPGECHRCGLLVWRPLCGWCLAELGRPAAAAIAVDLDTINGPEISDCARVRIA